MLPAPIWPLAEHASLGQNCCDASIGSVLVVFLFTASYGRTFFSIPPDLFTGEWSCTQQPCGLSFLSSIGSLLTKEILPLC